jgi:diguanylate cyclase (GGDEF)-like protein
MERDFRTTGSFLSQYLKERTRSMTAICDAMGSQPGIVAYLFNKETTVQNIKMAREDWATVSDIAEEMRPRLGAQSLTITDQEGTVIGRSPMTPRPIRPMKLSNDFLTRKSWQGIVEENGRPAIAVNVPVLIPGETYVGGSFYATYFMDNDLAHNLHDVLGNDVAFINNGQVVASSLPLSHLPPLPTTAQRSAQVLSQPVYSDSGERFLGSYQRISIQDSNAKLGVLLLHPYRDAMALSTDLESGLFLSFALALYVAVILGLVVSKRLTAPLDSVVNAAQQIQRGQWPEHLTVNRSDEIGLLQAAFNEMTTAVKSAQERLLARIDTDPLTELDNHRRFKERLTQEVRRAATAQEPLALILLDVDRFRTINEEYGLVVGDQVLFHISTLLTSHAPPVAIPARYGGDEFALILPRTTSGEVEEIAETLRNAVKETDNISFTLSIGYASYEKETAEPETLLLAAEFALTQAKHLGRDQVYRFVPPRGTFSPAGASGGESFLPAVSGPADLQHLYRFLRDGSLVAIQALAAAVDAKDHYTQGHSRRVADLSLLLAQRIGLSRDESDHVYVSAILHDVGKIGVPDHVLQKQGRLEPDELRMMQAHPEMGEIIVMKVPQLAATSPGVRWHHERWDGMGYPDRLRGEAIPLVARIIALADTFDAMTTDRPYRPGRDKAVVIEEIQTLSGKQFDPQLVGHFILVVREQLILQDEKETVLSGVRGG